MKTLKNICGKLFGWTLCMAGKHKQYDGYGNGPFYSCLRNFCDKGYYGEQGGKPALGWMSERQMMRALGIKPSQPIPDMTDSFR